MGMDCVARNGPRRMEWQDEGIIIGGRRYGETSLILEVMTSAHGRHPGLVRGGRSRRSLPLLQPGNRVSVTWRARLEDHLGTFVVETTGLHAAELIREPLGLQGLNTLLAHLRLLAEREPHPDLFAAALDLIPRLGDPQFAGAALARFELALLAEAGFGLDLDSCAATGRRDSLIYVSPKSGRAVSADAGAPYRDRLLPLPAFLRDADAAGGLAEVIDGFRTTSFFLLRDLYEARGLEMPHAREAFIAQLRGLL